MITEQQQAVINQALEIIENSLKIEGIQFTETTHVKNFVRLKIGTLEHEVFAILFLNSQHQLIKFDVPFQGTINEAPVYPREVAKLALRNNAAAVIFAHNHPSGNVEPSDADLRITARLKAALELFDIKVIDHVITGHINTLSFAEKGLFAQCRL